MMLTKKHFKLIAQQLAEAQAEAEQVFNLSGKESEWWMKGFVAAVDVIESVCEGDNPNFDCEKFRAVVFARWKSEDQS